jgi:hypothetical protein
MTEEEKQEIVKRVLLILADRFENINAGFWGSMISTLRLSASEREHPWEASDGTDKG